MLPPSCAELHLAENDLRREVLRCPTQCPGPTLHPLGKSKVSDLYVELIK